MCSYVLKPISVRSAADGGRINPGLAGTLVQPRRWSGLFPDEGCEGARLVLATPGWQASDLRGTRLQVCRFRHRRVCQLTDFRTDQARGAATGPSSLTLQKGAVVAIGNSQVIRLAVCAVLTAAAAVTAGCSSPPASSDYTKAYNVGLQAYTYGLPLLETNKTFLTMTSVNVPNGQGFGPVNQFSNVRKLNDPTSTAVVAPGANALSSIAWLDLSAEPQIVHVPRVTDHYFVLALLDPYTEDLRNLGSVHATPPGDYVVAGPGQHGVALPSGTHQISVNYNRIWIIGSTQLKGASDTAAVNRIQDGYTVTPLSKYNTGYRPPKPAKPDTTVETFSVPTGVAFFDTLGELLAQFPPPAADKDQLAAFAEVGIGVGLAPSDNTQLSAETLRGLNDAVAAGPAQIKADTTTVFQQSAKQHNGYFLGGFGAYGTNYQLRAVVSVMGLGAFTSDQAIFAMSLTDASAKALDGSSNYVVHMASAPPVTEGWTFTAYNAKGALMPNSLNRYQFSSASKLAKNADGSVDIYLQSTAPTDPAKAQNWLPVTSGQSFEVIWRLMAPKAEAIQPILDGTGWQPPALTQG